MENVNFDDCPIAIGFQLDTARPGTGEFIPYSNIDYYSIYHESEYSGVRYLSFSSDMAEIYGIDITI